MMAEKKKYGTPEVKKVKLVAEEAVLTNCKNGNATGPLDPAGAFGCRDPIAGVECKEPGS